MQIFLSLAFQTVRGVALRTVYIIRLALEDKGVLWLANQTMVHSLGIL